MAILNEEKPSERWREIRAIEAQRHDAMHARLSAYAVEAEAKRRRSKKRKIVDSMKGVIFKK